MKLFYFIIGTIIGSLSVAAAIITANKIDYSLMLVDPYDIFTDDEGTNK